MGHPQLITVEGAFEYFMGLILLIAAAFAVYVAAVYLGLAPDPTSILPASVLPASVLPAGDLPSSTADRPSSVAGREAAPPRARTAEIPRERRPESASVGLVVGRA